MPAMNMEVGPVVARIHVWSALALQECEADLSVQLSYFYYDQSL